MATRKTTTQKSSTSKSSAASSSSRTSKTSSTKKRPTIRREAWGIIYGVLGILLFMSLIGIGGAVLRWLKLLFGALIGYGFYALPFALIGLCILLFKQNKGPVRLRIFTIVMVPILIGSIGQGVVHADTFEMELSVLLKFIQTGAEITSGGIISGLLYSLLSWAISGMGTIILLSVLLIICIMVSFRVTPKMIWNMLVVPEYLYDNDEERQKYEAPPAPLPNIHEVRAKREEEKVQKKSTQQVKPNIDIPLDGEAMRVSDVKKTPKKSIIAKSCVEAITPSVEEVIKPIDEEETTSDAFDDILSLMDNKQEQKELKTDDFVEQDKNDFSIIATSIVEKKTFEPEKAPEPIVQQKSEPKNDKLDIPWESEPLKVFDNAQKMSAKKTEKQISQMEEEKLAEELSASQIQTAPIYIYPQLSLLENGKKPNMNDAKMELQESSQRLVETLQSFGIEAKIINIVRGPSVTRFEFTIERGIKFSRITALSDDIALALGAVSVRIAAIPDKIAIGIEVPNKTTAIVFIKEVLSSNEFRNAKSGVSFAIGKDITGAPVIGDIAKMPHMLIAGTTGSGKSVCINSMLISLLYKSPPEDVRLIMIDPKMVELGNYNGIPHLLIPVVTDPKKAAGALNWAVGEMERRYTLFAENSVRNLVGYNDIMRQKKAIAEQEEGGTPELYAKLPQIVIVIDELADLMMVAAKDVETSICRIAQKARAAGMHLVVATQRPSADVITGIMKSNIPSRIAFAVASQIESRIILDNTGAEKLIGKGDMLYAPMGGGKPQRVQGCYISNEDIESVIAEVKEGAEVEYSDEIMNHIEKAAEGGNSSGSSGGDASSDEDELFYDAADIVIEAKQASTSMLQRRLRLGYSRAARIIDQLEERGIVGEAEGSKGRPVLISREEWSEIKLRRKL